MALQTADTGALNGITGLGDSDNACHDLPEEVVHAFESHNCLLWNGIRTPQSTNPQIRRASEYGDGAGQVRMLTMEASYWTPWALSVSGHAAMLLDAATCITQDIPQVPGFQR